MITPDNMNLPFWLLNFEEIVEVLIGNQPHKETDAEILRELIPQAKLRYMSNQRRDRQNSLRDKMAAETSNVGVDTPVPYRSSDLIGLLEEYIGKLELRGELAPYKRLKARIETITRDPRYSFMFGSLTVQDTMAQILCRALPRPGQRQADRHPRARRAALRSHQCGGVGAGPACLRFRPVERRQGADHLRLRGGAPLCADRPQSAASSRPSGRFRASPRKAANTAYRSPSSPSGPAELDPTILSQCNTIFSFRLTNERDQEILKAGISDAAASLLEFVPTMGTGEAITFGEGVALPTRMKFDLLPDDSLPKSTTASFSHNWSQEITDEHFLVDIVARWRQQNFNPPADNAAPELAEEPAAPAAIVSVPSPSFGAAVRPRNALAGNGLKSPAYQPQSNGTMFAGGQSLRRDWQQARQAASRRRPIQPPSLRNRMRQISSNRELRSSRASPGSSCSTGARSICRQPAGPEICRFPGASWRARSRRSA